MKNSYISIIVVVVVLAAAWYLIGHGKNAQAPMSQTQTDTDTVNNSAPTINSNLNGAATGTADVNLTSGDLKEFTVTGQNYSFSPNLITVKKGDRVKITFKNVSGFHNLKIDEFGIATKPTEGPYQEVVQFAADKAGSFEYYCSVGSHRMMGMRGTLKVE